MKIHETQSKNGIMINANVGVKNQKQPPSGYAPKTPGLGIQRPDHYNNWGDIC